MKQKPVCEIVSLRDAEGRPQFNAVRPSLRWLHEIDQRAAYYLEVDPNRSGAAMLTCARQNAALARRAIGAGNTEGAAVTAMGALQAAWQAEMIEGHPVMRGGITSYRRSEAENAKRHEAAERERENWQRHAENIRKGFARKLTKKEIAEKIAKKIYPSDAKRASSRANTIRRYI